MALGGSDLRLVGMWYDRSPQPNGARVGPLPGVLCAPLPPGQTSAELRLTGLHIRGGHSQA